MNRSDATTYIANSLNTVLAAAGVTATDTAGGLKEVIDDSLRALGYAEATLATADTTLDETTGYLALLRFFTLRKVFQAVALKVDLAVGQDSKKWSQAKDAVKDMLSEARRDAKPWMETDESFGMFHLNLDIFEPEPITIPEEEA